MKAKKLTQRQHLSAIACCEFDRPPPGPVVILRRVLASQLCLLCALTAFPIESQADTTIQYTRFMAFNPNIVIGGEPVGFVLFYSGPCLQNPDTVAYYVGPTPYLPDYLAACNWRGARLRDTIRRSLDGYGACVTFSTSLSGPENCGAFTMPVCNITIGVHPVPRGSPEEAACSTEVCHAPPFSTTVSPQVSSYGTCTDNFVHCDSIAPHGTFEELQDIFLGLIAPPFGIDLLIEAARCLPPGTKTEHWAHVSGDSITSVSGFVAGGPRSDSDNVCITGLECTAPGSPQPAGGHLCKYPNVSRSDYGFHHIDRDFEFHIIPLSGGALDGSVLAPENTTINEGGGIPSIGVEVEYMYFYPREGPGLSHYSVPLVGLSLPSSIVSPDGWQAYFPTAGDQITTAGLLVWDCGHLGRYIDFPVPVPQGFKTEIHPPLASAWLHRNQQPGTSTLVLKGMSHAPIPSGTHPPFPATGFNADFTLDRRRALCVSGPILDYNLTMQAYQSFNNGTTDSNPYATFLGSADRPLASDWRIELLPVGDGRLHLSVNLISSEASIGVDPNSDFPLLMGAHFEVCQPGIDDSGNIISCSGRCYLTTAQIMEVVSAVLQ